MPTIVQAISPRFAARPEARACTVMSDHNVGPSWLTLMVAVGIHAAGIAIASRFTQPAALKQEPILIEFAMVEASEAPSPDPAASVPLADRAEAAPLPPVEADQSTTLSMSEEAAPDLTPQASVLAEPAPPRPRPADEILPSPAIVHPAPPRQASVPSRRETPRRVATRDVTPETVQGSTAPSATPVQAPMNTMPAARDVNQEAALQARIRDAVQASVRYPSAARMMGITGRARILLDYRDGAVGGPMLVQPSGSPVLDQAALAAAQTARYPVPPAVLVGHLLRLLVWVEFRPG
jgi:protein TonB